VVKVQKSTKKLLIHNHFTAIWICPGQTGWAGTRRNIHLLSPVVVIKYPLSASSIFYDSWHPLCPFSGFCPGLLGWAGTRKVNQSGFTGARDSEWRWHSLAICPHPRHITTPESHHSVFYRPVALPAAQPTVSKHWRCY